MRAVKSGGCTACHALGNLATREVPAELGEFDSMEAAWDRRIQSGQAGGSMSNGLDRMGRSRAIRMFADWTDRILAGELPAEAPRRPQGVERNVVVTQWDWADPRAYLHDEIATDKRNPTVNAYGPIYGALEASADYVPVLDPVANAASEVPVPVRDPEHPRRGGAAAGVVPLLGRRGDLEQPVQRPQPDARPGRPRLADLARAGTGQPRDVPGGLGPSVRAGVSQRASRVGTWPSGIRRRRR